MAVAPSRIGKGTWFTALGVVCILLGVFAAMASAGGSSEAGGFAIVFCTLGGALIALGFWVKLFGLIERRLMDIEARLAPAEADKSTPARPPAEPVVETY